jgi:hypothetical protein
LKKPERCLLLNAKDEVIEVMMVLPTMTEPGVYRDVKFYLKKKKKRRRT